jgi:hypothetical protein
VPSTSSAQPSRQRLIVPSILRPPSASHPEPLPENDEALRDLTEACTSANTRQNSTHRMILRSIRPTKRCQCCDQYEEDCSRNRHYRRK